MTERIFTTNRGSIHYWINEILPGRRTLVFLPGLTADHHLFDKQIRFFKDEYNILTWDAPGHAASRPFTLDFTLMDKALWLHEILENEKITRPVLIGQSMGGYVSQCFMEKYPGETAGFISIDSAPIQRRYMARWEIWSLKHTEPMYRAFPWKLLKKLGTNGCAESRYGRRLMLQFFETYKKGEYCRLAGRGFYMVAEAIEADLPYVIDCPAVLICGEKDQAGFVRHYNRSWAEKEGLPLCRIRKAGHNANTDRPEQVNRIIRKFVRSLKAS